VSGVPFRSQALLVAALASCSYELAASKGPELPQGEIDADLPSELDWHRSNIVPGPGYRLAGALKRPIVWATTVPQMPTPIPWSVEHVHFADVGRKWGTIVRVPRGPDHSTRLSPDQRRISSYGVLYKNPQDLTGPVDRLLGVVRIADGELLWSLAFRPPVHALDVGWLSNEAFAYSFDRGYAERKGKQHVIRRVDLVTGEQRDIYEAPPGCSLFSFLPGPSAMRLLVREAAEPERGRSILHIVDLSSGTKREIPSSRQGMDPFSYRWWPDERHVFFEETGDHGRGPVNVSAEDPTKVTPLSGQFPMLGRDTQGSLSPSGKRLLMGHTKLGKVYLLDLETGVESEILALRNGPAGCAVERVAWSRDEKVAVGWVRMTWARTAKRPGGIVGGVFAIDFERRELTFFRGDQESRPTFLIEEPEVIEALKARSVPWQ
jgi:hypothetical protein